MQVNIYPLVSSLHSKERIKQDTLELLNNLMNSSEHTFKIVDIDELYDGDLALILIQSGGSENLFLENFNKLKAPYYLLTYGHNNSLAASLEILSYIKDNNLKGEVLHGSLNYILNRINNLKNKEVTSRLGVIGKPSDWLIASQVNYIDAEIHNVELVDIDIQEVIDLYNLDDSNYESNFNYDKEEISKALKLHNVILKIKEKYKLSGVTIRCFDLLNKVNTTACLSLSLLNKDRVIGTCEGDIPTLITMHILNKVTNKVGFQANPSRIDIENKRIVFAHCTLPLDMPTSYSFNTHFESNIGVAIKGELKEEEITIFKLSRNLKDYVLLKGRIIRNLNEDNLCRTQIEVSIDENIEYFLNRPYGNHHVIIYGDHTKEIKEYMDNLSNY